MTKTLEALLEKVRSLPPKTPEEREEQARSFAFGNLAIDRPELTRAEIDATARRMGRRRIACDIEAEDKVHD